MDSRTHAAFHTFWDRRRSRDMKRVNGHLIDYFNFNRKSIHHHYNGKRIRRPWKLIIFFSFVCNFFCSSICTSPRLNTFVCPLIYNVLVRSEFTRKRFLRRVLFINTTTSIEKGIGFLFFVVASKWIKIIIKGEENVEGG